MPDSLFAPRRFRRSYLVYCTIAAFAVHGSLVGVGHIYRQFKTTDIPPVVTEIVEVPLTEQVQELILPKEDPVPTPEEPTPPPDETPPPEETPPPPDEEPEMTLDTPKPTPTPGPKKPFRPTGTPFPSNAKRGDVPQYGVVGGVPHAEKTTGKPGGTWHASAKPPYPYQARAAHLSGSGTIRITTDGSGRVTSASMSQSTGSSLLDNAATSFAKANYSGPPNSATSVPITFKMQ